LEFQHYPLEWSSLPVRWCATSVGEVALDIQPGFASGKHNKEGVGIPHIRPMNIDRLGRIDLSDVKYVAPETHSSRLGKGDVLFNNTNSAELIGKTAAITLKEDWGFSNHMTRLRLPEGVDHRFVAHQLHFLWMTGYFLHRCVHHVNQASLSSTALAETVPLLLAPSEEQRRIVAKIEELFSDLDAGVAALERVRANLKRYRASVLKAAVEGKLTEDWRSQHPDTEPASVLLERILTERRRQWEKDQLAKFAAAGKQPPKGWREKYQPPIAFDWKHAPRLAGGWSWATLDEIGQENRPILYGIIKPGPHVEDGVPYVRVTEMKDGRIDVQSLRRTARARAEKFARATLKAGDLLISKDGTIGRVAVVPPDLEGGNITQHVMRVPINESLVLSYVVWAIRSQPCQHWLTGETRGVALQGVNVADFRRLPIPIPPLEEQVAVVSEVERRLSIVDEIEAQVEANLKRATRLRQGILKRAFEGRLVPQDATDEAAERLLERIRQGRDGVASTLSRRGKTKHMLNADLPLFEGGYDPSQ
jgi:type I restriction enzyme S subunit